MNKNTAKDQSSKSDVSTCDKNNKNPVIKVKLGTATCGTCCSNS